MVAKTCRLCRTSHGKIESRAFQPDPVRRIQDLAGPVESCDCPARFTSLYGISLAVDRYIPLGDGYYLIGHTEWADGRITSASPAGWALKAYDSKGQEVALEPADWQDAGLTPEANQWLYRLYGKSFNAPTHLSCHPDGCEIQAAGQADARFALVWFRRVGGSTGDDLENSGDSRWMCRACLASVFKVTYMKLGDMKGFEIGIDADPALQGLPFTIESGLDTAGMSAVASGGARTGMKPVGCCSPPS